MNRNCYINQVVIIIILLFPIYLLSNSSLSSELEKFRYGYEASLNDKNIEVKINALQSLTKYKIDEIKQFLNVKKIENILIATFLKYDQRLHWKLKPILKHFRNKNLEFKLVSQLKEKRLRKEIIELVGEWKLNEYTSLIVPFLEARDQDIIRLTIVSLGKLKEKKYSAQIASFLYEYNSQIQIEAIKSLTNMNAFEYKKEIYSLLVRNADPDLTNPCIDALAKFNAVEYCSKIAEYLEYQRFRDRSIIALAELNAVEFAKNIEKYLSDQNFYRTAIWALNKLDQKKYALKSFKALIQFSESSETQNKELLKYLNKTDLEKIEKYLADPFPQIRVAAIKLLKYTKLSEVPFKISRLLKDKNSNVRMAALQALIFMKSKIYLNEVIDFYYENPSYYYLVKQYLLVTNNIAQLNELFEISIKSNSTNLKLAAIKLIDKMTPEDLKPYLIEIEGLLKHEKIFPVAMEILAYSYPDKYKNLVHSYLNDPNPQIKKIACDILSELRAQEYSDEISKLIFSNNLIVKSSAISALQHLKYNKFNEKIWKELLNCQVNNETKYLAKEVMKNIVEVNSHLFLDFYENYNLSINETFRFLEQIDNPPKYWEIPFLNQLIYNPSKAAETRFYIHKIGRGNSKTEQILNLFNTEDVELLQFKRGEQEKLLIYLNDMLKQCIQYNNLAKKTGDVIITLVKKINIKRNKDLIKRIVNTFNEVNLYQHIDYIHQYSDSKNRSIFSEIFSIIRIPLLIMFITFVLTNITYLIYILLYEKEMRIRNEIFKDKFDNNLILLLLLSKTIISRTAFFSRKLLNLYKDGLKNDLDHLQHDKQIYYKNQLISKKTNYEFDSNTEIPLRSLIDFKGICILEGKSGSGKSAFLRYLLKVNETKNLRIFVLLNATECFDGVIRAILKKMLPGLECNEFVFTLISNGFLDVLIDGVNEVTENVKNMIHEFLSNLQKTKANILLTTQPDFMPYVRSMEVYKILPLNSNSVREFLSIQLKECKRKNKEELIGEATRTVQYNRIINNPQDLIVIKYLIEKDIRPIPQNLYFQYFEMVKMKFLEKNDYDFPEILFADYLYSNSQNLMLFEEMHFGRVFKVLRDKFIVSKRKEIINEKTTTCYKFRHNKLFSLFVLPKFIQNNELLIKHLGKEERNKFKFVYILFIISQDKEKVKNLLIEIQRTIFSEKSEIDGVAFLNEANDAYCSREE